MENTYDEKFTHVFQKHFRPNMLLFEVHFPEVFWTTIAFLPLEQEAPDDSGASTILHNS